MTLRIVIDTREPNPHPWESHLTLPWVRDTLATGDFSLPGAGHLIAVERKTMSDLLGCLTSSRQRFEKELSRGMALDWFGVVVEGRWVDFYHGDYRSQMNPHSAVQSVITFMVRYRCPFLFAESEAGAAHVVESILQKWHREQGERLKDVARASRAYEKAMKGLVTDRRIDEED